MQSTEILRLIAYVPTAPNKNIHQVKAQSSKKPVFMYRMQSLNKVK